MHTLPVMSMTEQPPESHDDTPFRRRRLRRPLPLWLRIMVFLVGWIVVLVGVAGLVLPGPGILTIGAGAAILSVVSEAIYELTRKSLQRWPYIWDRVEKFRERVHDRLHRWAHGKS